MSEKTTIFAEIPRHLTGVVEATGSPETGGGVVTLALRASRFLWVFGQWELTQTGYPIRQGYALTRHSALLAGFEVLAKRDPKAAAKVLRALERYVA